MMDRSRLSPGANRIGTVLVCLALTTLALEITALAQVQLTEFGAVNARVLLDEDASPEDWIEVANLGSSPINLGGWHLTDDPDSPRKWTFPSTNLNAQTYLVVFASSKDRRVPGNPLHTNFRLSSDGEYLALIQPDGETVATEFAAAYPRQFRDVSFGFGLEQETTVLVEQPAPGRFAVPINDSLGSAWTLPEFDDTNWLPILNGLGYDTGEVDPAEGSYAARIQATEPALYWRLDESSGLNALNLGSLADTASGRYEGDPLLGQPGPRPPHFIDFESDNRAPTLDGIDDYVGGPPRLLSDRAGFTMAGWIRPTQTQSSRTGLFGQNDAVEFGFINSSTLQLWTFAGNVELPYPHPLGQWHHLAAVGTLNSLQIYLDGILQAEASGGGGNFGSSPYAFNAGGGGIFDASGNPFAGQIDEVSVWTRSLSAQEITALFDGSTPVDYGPYFATDVQTHLHQVNSSYYVRFPFTVPDPSKVGRLILRVRYDDGLAAWLNGHPVASLNAPEILAWNATATQRHPDNRAIAWQELDLTAHVGTLVPGANILALQGLNITANNTDLLLQVELIAIRQGLLTSTPRYFTVPTPGSSNGGGTDDLGPILVDARHVPDQPAHTDTLTVQADVSEAFAPISTVQLHYRVMFGTETTLPMNDSGTNGDSLADDGVWTAWIPAAAAAPGQLLRYYVTATDAEGRTARWPLYPDPLDSEAYLGTVVADPAIHSALPVVHLFLENPGAADTTSGTRASLFHHGELYDNVRMSVHGQSSRGFPKKSYNLDFTSDHRFLYRRDATRVKDIRLMSNWGDKARVRNALAYDYLAEAGSLAHFAFQVRVQRNAQFFSIADMMEDGDDRWLERIGRDPRGALYKIYNNLGSAGGNEKKTRRWEDFSDLQDLVNGLDESRPLTQRALYGWDRIDLPQTVSYFVGLALISSQDHGHKNYYVYCDNDASGEWAILPWDVDLTWGRNWLDAQGYFTDTLFQDNVLNFYNPAQQNKPSNRLYNLIFQHPEFRSMVLRRLRTVMESVLQPPGTPASELRIEARVRQMMETMDPPEIGTSDADLDYARWGSWGNGNPMRTEGYRILATHLPGRRTFLFQQDPQLNGESIPPTQPPDATLQFAALEFNPPSGNQAEEFLELANPHPYAIDISHWRIEGAVRHTFRPGTVVPPSRSIHLSPDVRAFRARSTAPHGGQGLFVQGPYSGQLSAWGETLTLVDPHDHVKATHTYAGNPSAAQRYLRITEIFYHPDPVSDLDHDLEHFEFLELRNTGPTPLDLAGIRLSRGVQFDFTDSPITTLEPQASVLVVRNLAAFTSRYTTTLPIAGQFIGALDNAGETLRLDDASGEKILEFDYHNTWHPITDGLGFSLVVRDPTVPWEDWGHASNWRPSAQPGGSPGTIDPPPPPPLPVVVNELLAHTDPPQLDAVELWNPGPNDADLSGYYLTDDFFTPRKYRLPTGTLLRAGAYYVLTATDFNPAPGEPHSFAFSALGEQVVLFAAKPDGDLVGTWHGFEFGASPNGVPFIRHLDNQGREHFVLATALTLGTVNAPPRVGPVAITEILYHPPELDDAAEAPYEYLELRNLTDFPQPLYHPDHPQHTWKLQQAVTYDFPPEITLPPHGTLLVVGFDPADPAASSAFRTRYQLTSAIPLLGPWQGRLENAGEAIDLLQPDTPNPDTVPFILVDRVAYRDRAPWPPAADGLGSSLQRQPIHAFGNDPAHWFASPPTPGADNTVNLPPRIDLISPSPGTTYQRPVDVLLAADANDPDGPVTRVEFFANASRLGETHTAPYVFNWLNAPAGHHLLTARAHDDRLGFSDSEPVAIEIYSQPPEIEITQPEPQALVGVGLDTPMTAEASDPDGSVVQVELLVNGVPVGLALRPPFTLLWIPPQTGPFHLTAIATDDSGATRESPTRTVNAVPAFQEQRIIIPPHATWQVRDNGTAPDPTWTMPAYDASSWNLGFAELGYGDGDENTVISYGPNSSSKYITTWFRHPFTVSPSANLTAASLRLVRDDGVMVYLDGIEIFRDNLPDGPIFPTTTALAAISGTDESSWLTTSIPPTLLTPGPHVLGVEMHQVNGTSSDLSFNAELIAVETTFSPVITGIQLNPDGTTLTLQFPAVAGHSYSLQQTAALAIHDWVNAHQIPAATTNRTVSLELAIDTHHTELFRLITPAQP